MTKTAKPANFNLPERETIIGYKLRRAQLLVFQDFLHTFARMKLRPAEFSVLAMIARTPGLKQTEIAEALGIKRANFVPMIHALEERALVERRPSRQDRRANALHLTAEGTKFVTKIRRRHDRLESDLTEKLGGPTNRDLLLSLLRKLA